MKKFSLNIKKILLVSLIFAVSIFTFGMAITSNTAIAETQSDVFLYRNQLSALEKKFYDAIDSMNNAETLKSGAGEYDLVSGNVLDQSRIKSFLNGDNQVLRAFGAGKDAYFLDHPEIFYVDFDALSINLATKGENYLASIGTGRRASYYVQNSFSSTSEVNEAIDTLQSAVSSIVSKVTAPTLQEKIEQANSLLCEKVTYDFCNLEALSAYEPNIRTAYGSLVNGYAVCEGYARGFKLIMDNLDIPCVEVIGYYIDGEANEPHAWNYCMLDGKWYLVDPTMNDSGAKFGLYGSEYAKKHYIADGFISQSGYEVRYPQLATYDYGYQPIETRIEYSDDSIDYIFASYDNSNAFKLKKEGLYLVAQHGETTTQGFVWYYPYAVAQPQLETADAEESRVPINANYQLTRFFVTTEAPNGTIIADTYNTLDQDKIICVSDIIENAKYGTSQSRPYVNNTTPSQIGLYSTAKTYDITVEYTDELVLDNPSLPVDVSVFTAEEQKNLENYIKIEQVEFDGNKTIRFKFTPSKMFEHNELTYYFNPVNIISKRNSTIPMPASFTFGRVGYACNKVFGDGRMYLDVFGSPTLVDNNDLSLNDWTLPDGSKVGNNQRSQLALVVSKTDDLDSKTMMDKVEDTTGLTNQDIKASATYDIELNLCRMITQIPNGSYLKVAFGFPEGFSAKDEGVTFKLYHFKRDASGNIDHSDPEEIECVITEYGLIATIKSFSPFMVVAVDSNKVENQNKMVYVRNSNQGGNFEVLVNDVKTTEVAKVADGQTLKVKITAEQDSQVDYVLVNKKLTSVVNGEITLSYGDLENSNIIDIAYVAKTVAQKEQAEGITNLNKSFAQNYAVETNDEPPTKSNALLIVCIVVGVVVVLGAVTFVIFSKKRKNKIAK